MTYNERKVTVSIVENNMLSISFYTPSGEDMTVILKGVASNGCLYVRQLEIQNHEELRNCRYEDVVEAIKGYCSYGRRIVLV